MLILFHLQNTEIFYLKVNKCHYKCDYLVLCGFDYERQEIDTRFSNIITNNNTCYDVISEEKIFLSKNVYTMIIDKNWEFLESKNFLINNIEKFVRVGNRFITHNERHTT